MVQDSRAQLVGKTARPFEGVTEQLLNFRQLGGQGEFSTYSLELQPRAGQELLHILMQEPGDLPPFPFLCLDQIHRQSLQLSGY
jgi:hypothetical protein